MKRTILYLLVGAYTAAISQGAAITQPAPQPYAIGPADAGFTDSPGDQGVEVMKKKKKKKKKKSRAS
jgi:hypothetical protein